MPRRALLALSCALLLSGGSIRLACGSPPVLTDEDRKLFAWFDGIGLPSCAGKPYVRLHWVQEAAAPDAPRADEVWEVDGFVVAEKGDNLTLLDGDLWPRKVTRKPSPGWKGGVANLELSLVAAAAIGRLKAIKSDPGAVEGMDDLYRGMRIHFGDEAQSLALARHCAENGLEREAHALIEAARALPTTMGALPGQAPGAAQAVPFDQVVAAQMGESVIWRIVYDFSNPDIPRASLLERLRGWRRSFPASPHVAKADDLLRVLPRMVEEEGMHPAVPDGDLERLPPAEQASELVWRLRDQEGDVYRTRSGRVSIDFAKDAPSGRLLAMGREAAGQLIEALTDDRTTRAVLFLRDMAFRRLVIARVGDLARVVLEAIAKEDFWDVPEDEPSMFQHEGAAKEVQEKAREWLKTAGEAGGDGKEGAK